MNANISNVNMLRRNTLIWGAKCEMNRFIFWRIPQRIFHPGNIPDDKLNGCFLSTWSTLLTPQWGFPGDNGEQTYYANEGIIFASEIVPLSFVVIKRCHLSARMAARYNQVYLLIFWLIKSDYNSRNIHIFIISQLPQITPCKMGDVG